ncbi:peptidoglycan-binding domain-containing protein [Streptomyces sp. SCSIO 30461]|uniref:peptidoglycan-binding domain-containing protein n=1 Tax=Streptomyces sp. SCSIO 30461 TaxID=3118085 RepID=UPI0030D2FD42
MTGRACPECGGASPTRRCACTVRAERDAERTAELAAAEDFDPLRIRPYVTLPTPPGADPGHAPPGRFRTQEIPEIQEISHGHEYAYEIPAPGAASPAAPPREPARRRGPGVLIAAAAAAAALGTGAAFAGGLFSGDKGGTDQALPDIETVEPFLSAAPKAPSSGTPSASKKPGASPSASPSARTSSPSASASADVSPSVSASRASGASASPSGTAFPSPLVSRSPAAPTTTAALRRGDSGSEVVELQERLAQFGLYDGPSHGRFDGHVEWAVAYFQAIRGITDDSQGVYGPVTRKALEAETQYPYDDGWGDDGSKSGNGGRH